MNFDVKVNILYFKSFNESDITNKFRKNFLPQNFITRKNERKISEHKIYYRNKGNIRNELNICKITHKTVKAIKLFYYQIIDKENFI